MKRFYGLNNIFNFLIAILCACFFSCDYLCDEDLKMRLDEETFTKIHFYSNKEESLVSGEELFLTVRSYRIGDTISEKDLPTYNDSEISQWKTGYRLGGWKYYRWTLSQQQIVDSSLITSITVTPDELDLYAVWFVPYTVIYKYENNDGTGYDEKKEIRYGEPGAYTDANPPEISAFSTPVYSNKTILEDGSTEVVVKYDREYFTHKITYYDSSFSSVEKSFSGDTTTLPTEYIEGQKRHIPSPVSIIPASENTVDFAGWFKDSSGTVPLEKDAGGYYISSTSTKNISLYAKWKSKFIYVDPSNYFSNANDDNNGLSSASPLPTIDQAKQYLLNDAVLESPVVRVLSQISDINEIKELDNLTTETYKNAILQRASSKVDSSFITVSDDCSLSNITIDGGSEYSSIDTPVIVSGGKLTLGTGVVIQNFKIDNSSVNGLIDLSQGGSLSLNGAEINNNSVLSGYSIYHSNSTSKLSVSGDTQIDSATPVYLAKDCKITIEANLNNDTVAKVYSSEYSSGPKVLDDDTSGTLVQANYNKFISAHDGYSIAQNGILYLLADLEIDYSNPDIKVYELGNFENFTGTINLSGSSEVDFAVNNDIYEYITDADVSGQRVIYVSIMNDNGDVMFTNKVNIDSTTKKATVDLITDSSGTNSITSSGIYHAVIYTKASSLYANIYFERVYFDILVLP